MERQEVISGVGQLPTIELGRVPVDSEAFEGDDNGAHYIVTKTRIEGSLVMFSLSVSGLPAARQSLIRDFCEALGQPTQLETNPELPDVVEYATWVGIDADQ